MDVHKKPIKVELSLEEYEAFQEWVGGNTAPSEGVQRARELMKKAQARKDDADTDDIDA